MLPILAFLITLLVLLVIGGIVFYVIRTYVIPGLPANLQAPIMAITALIMLVVFLYLLLPGPFGVGWRIGLG